MKDEVLHGLLTARSLFATARRHCFVRDRYIASAGLIIVQDAFELVVYSCLLEVGADKDSAIESFSFDQLIGELRKRGLPIIKAGTLKAMNKQRVLIKHHAQLAEPAAVQNYYQASLLAADNLLEHIIGKPIQQIVVADAITDEDLARHIRDASLAIEQRLYLEAMVTCRKALYIAVESEYDIREWAIYDDSQFYLMPLFSGRKAPVFTRNRDWISVNVKMPTDYVQLDHDRVATDMLQIGIDPEEFFNVWRLTPAVYLREDKSWAVSLGPEHYSAATEENARYCLDIVAAILTNQATHRDQIRSTPHTGWIGRLKCDEPVRVKASADAPLEGHSLAMGTTVNVTHLGASLDGSGEYFEVFQDIDDPPTYIWGFIRKDACTIETVEEEV